MNLAQIDSEILKSNQEMHTFMKQQNKFQQEIKELSKQLAKVQDAFWTTVIGCVNVQRMNNNLCGIENHSRFSQVKVSYKLQAYSNDIAKLKQE